MKQNAQSNSHLRTRKRLSPRLISKRSPHVETSGSFNSVALRQGNGAWGYRQGRLWCHPYNTSGADLDTAPNSGPARSRGYAVSGGHIGPKGLPHRDSLFDIDFARLRTRLSRTTRQSEVQPTTRKAVARIEFIHSHISCSTDKNRRKLRQGRSAVEMLAAKSLCNWLQLPQFERLHPSWTRPSSE